MAVYFWIAVGIVITGVFGWMWRYATKIEIAVEREEQWLKHIRKVKQEDPQQAKRLWEEFEKEFLE